MGMRRVDAVIGSMLGVLVVITAGAMPARAEAGGAAEGAGGLHGGLSVLTVAHQQPASAPTQTGPTGEIAGTRRPVFAWDPVEHATWYRVFVQRVGDRVVIDQWTQEATLTPPSDLAAATYRWWVVAWSPDGYGPWSGAMEFMIPLQAPGAIALIGPQGEQAGHNLTYRWEQDANATWYRLWVGRQGAGTWHDRWYNLTGEGEAAVELADHPAGTFTWWLHAWGPDGFGPWSGPGEFTTPSQDPTAPVLVSPLGETVENPPLFAWESERAEWCRVYVQRVGGGAVFDDWTADTTLTPAAALLAGQYAWWVGAWNRVTRRVVWSQRGDFAVADTPPPIPDADMVPIPGGTNSGTDPDFGNYSLTVDSFYMDTYPVTKALWDDVYNWAIANGYSFDNAGLGKAANHPVHSVNWYDAVKWCNARSEKESRPPVYTVDGAVYRTGQPNDVVQTSAAGYRLPTGVEWAYAARGGVASRRFPWADSDTIQHARANYFSSDLHAYDTSPTPGYHPTYNDGTNSLTSPVGAFAPNGYGLYDMAGNVAEWCIDVVASIRREVRGGSWNSFAAACRVANRHSHNPDVADDRIGLRTVLPSSADMALIPGGTNSGTDPDYGAYSLTVSTFYMDKYPVTKALWDTVYSWAITNSYSFDNVGLGKGANHPVYTVNWYDAVKWCNARSERAGRPPVYTVNGTVYRSGQSDNVVQTAAAGYRLPTTVEFEYAARGGESGLRFPWGNTITHIHANYWANGSQFTYDTSPYTTFTHHPAYEVGDRPYTSPVGAFAPNGYGLYDMVGNVLEWCYDRHPIHSTYRLLRGASWDSSADHCRVGNDFISLPAGAGNIYGGLGLRAVRSAQ